MLRKALAAAGLAAALAGAFAYGYRAHRDRLFPADLIDPPRTRAPERPASRPLVWQPVRQHPDASLDERQRAAAEIESLPYLQGYKRAGAAGGVSFHDPLRASPGVNLYNSGHGPEAYLIDMQGAVLHQWRRTFREAFPDAPIPEERKEQSSFWRRVHLYPNGDLLAIFEGLGIVKLDSDSRLLWAVAGGFHHALDVAEDGRIYALEGTRKRLPRISREAEVIEDFATALDPGGQVLERTSLLKCFELSDYAPLLSDMKTAGDLFHTNAIRVLDGRLEKKSPLFKKGRLLVSVLALDTVALVDPSEKRVVWALKGLWDAQHEPVLLDSGRLLVFDNLGYRGDTRVLELDPFTQAVTWSFAGSEALPFSSWKAGTNQRLPNGNTLIAESTGGRALEVTPDKKLVWEFMNPFRAGAERELIATLYEMRRFGAELPYRSWAKPPGR